MVIVLMGVTGAGKTTVGTRLAGSLGWSFYDADAFHPEENVERMRVGEPLDERHREPWLAALEALIREALVRGGSAVLACSALRSSYREQLGRPAKEELGEVRFVFLSITPEDARDRLQQRDGHFMPPELVKSQFEVLEVPPEVLTLDATRPVDALVQDVRRAFGV